jgi:hypothetical protein
MAFTAAFLAFTVLTTLAIGKAVRERVQLQNAADASAYSLAVQEARAFNFYAYTNRAIISHFVVMMSVYGHMSYLAYWEGAVYEIATQWGCSGGGSDFINIPNELEFMPLEDPMCWDVFGGEAECAECEECIQEEEEYIDSSVCPNVSQALQNIDQEVGKSSQPGSCMSKLVTEAATVHRTGLVGALKLEQTAQDTTIVNSFMGATGSTLNQQIAQQFDKNYGAGMAGGRAVGAINLGGIPLDNNTAGYCMVGGDLVGSAGPVTSPDPLCTSGGMTSLSTQQQAANASRYGPAAAGGSDWLNNRPDGLLSTINLYIMGTAGFGFVPVMRMGGLTNGKGMSREITDGANNMPQTVNGGGNNQGGCSGTNCGSQGGGSRGFGGEDSGRLGSLDAECNIQCLAIVPAVDWKSYQVWIYSEPQGNSQGEQSTIQWADGTTTASDDWDIGACTGSICGVGVTTINYNPSPDPATLFYQPHTWGLVTKSFNNSNLTTSINSQSYGSTQDEGPFAMKRSISMDSANSYTYNNGITLPSGDADYAPGREAMYAVAQGLAYYHRPGNWQEPPNFYNPYWRAKLQPIEMATGGSNSDAAKDVAALMIAGGYPAAQAAEFGVAIAAGTYPVTE